MGGSGWVWQIWNFMTRTQPDPLSKKKFITQPNPPSPKNRPNLAGWVGSVLASWWVGCTPLELIVEFKAIEM